MLHHSKHYKPIREFLDTVPVIDTHEHHTGAVLPPGEPFLKQVLGYYWSDLVNAGFEAAQTAESAFSSPQTPTQAQYDLFDKLYRRSCHTAYARAFRLGLNACWGIEEISGQSLRQLEERHSSRDPQFYDQLADKYGIKAIISDMFFEGKNLIEGKDRNISAICKLAFSLPDLHRLHRKPQAYMLNEYLDRTITCLDDYLESIEHYLRKALEFGVICFKDQSAYGRTLEYDLPSRAEAEKVFNRMIFHPRGHVGSEEAKVLDDWLFHHFMRLAEIHDLPVQLHTGHMAGLRNDIVKTNAAGFIPVMELHNRVKFDLFHGNWPYMDEYLFIGKNYPNAYLNLCWVQTIDPYYCVELMKRAVMTIPHCKIMAYGGDARLMEQSIGYLIMARDNVAYALTELIECGWLGMQEAKQLAIDWFYNNPIEFYKLGFTPVSV
jgi:hypothetical protein